MSNSRDRNNDIDIWWKQLSENIAIKAFNSYPAALRLDDDHKGCLQAIMTLMGERRRSIIWLHSTKELTPPDKAVTISLANVLKKEDRLGGKFVCHSPNTSGRNYLDGIFPAVAYQLGVPRNHFSARCSVVQALRQDPALLHEQSSFVDQIRPLFHEPLKCLRNPWKEGCAANADRSVPKTRAFIFDRIDNCCPPAAYENVAYFLELLLQIVQEDSSIPEAHLFFASGPNFSLEQVFGLFNDPSAAGPLQVLKLPTQSHITIISLPLEKHDSLSSSFSGVPTDDGGDDKE
ncbi:hypothetical protein CONPUDRAFT_167186, partial [Coniophora puteana RWD-64-598 SS2]